MKWSMAEIQTLREKYDSNAKELADELEKRSPQAIRTKAHELGLSEDQADEWTDLELKKLEIEYPLKPSSKLAEEMGRTQEAVKTRARKEGIQKEDYHTLKYDLAKTQPKNFEKNPENSFLAGIAAGEATFTTNKNKAGRPQYTFRILMAERDEEVLKKFQKVIGAGNINYYTSDNPTHEDQVRFDVCGVVDIVNHVIPFFDTVGLRNTYKQKQFSEWKKDLFESYNIEGIKDPDFESEMEDENE